jgi:hypothetical protein
LPASGVAFQDEHRAKTLGDNPEQAWAASLIEIEFHMLTCVGLSVRMLFQKQIRTPLAA